MDRTGWVVAVALMVTRTPIGNDATARGVEIRVRQEERDVTTEGPGPRIPAIASLHLSVWTGFPDIGLAASVAVHAIPFLDLEGGASYSVVFYSAVIRGGPTFEAANSRDARGRGFSLRMGGLAGYRWGDGYGPAGPWGDGLSLRHAGFDGVMLVQPMYWFAPHFGLSARLTFGGFVTGAEVLPDIRFGFGFSF
jgi:hypothetical protein